MTKKGATLKTSRPFLMLYPKTETLKALIFICKYS